MVASALEAVRAVEKLRHATSKGMQSLAGHTAGIIKEDCRDFLRIKEFEDVPLSILDDIEATPCDFSIAGGNGGPLEWDSIIGKLGARIKKKEEAKQRVDRLRSEIDTIVGRIEVALVISEVVGYVALAVSILRGGIGVWRRLVKKPPPTVPIGGRPSVPPKATTGVPIKPERSVWELGPSRRGLELERRLAGERLVTEGGSRLPPNFPTVDKWESGVATSIKSVDLRAPTYQDAAALRSRLNGYVDKVAEFRGGTRSSVTINPDEISVRQLEVAVPAGSATAEQLAVIEELVARARAKGVVVLIREME